MRERAKRNCYTFSHILSCTNSDSLQPQIGTAVTAGDSSALLSLLRLDRNLFVDSEKEPFGAILAAADAVELGADDLLLGMREEESVKLQVCCGVLQCVAVSCSVRVLHPIAACCSVLLGMHEVEPVKLQCVTVFGIVLQ